MTKKFIIMRGLPGSGKSFKARKLVEDGQIFSTDDFWCLKDPKVYNFEKNKLGYAHRWNQRRVAAAVKAQLPVIIVDNTNTTLKELKGYREIAFDAQDLGYDISIVEPDTEWAFNVDECFKRNSHNVPFEVLQAMADRYQTVTLSEFLTETD